jgi:tetratricopeptide (TPR) repeat protein
MSEHLGYIDSYFNKELSPEECRIFELRIEQDPAFAEEVAFYLNTLNEAKAQLAGSKKERFREIYQEIRPSQRPGLVRRFWPYVSAAAVTIALVFRFVFFSPSMSPLKLADEYIQTNLVELPSTMGPADSLEMGKKLYNDSNYIEALVLFESMLLRDSTQSEAKKFAGIASLKLEKYDKALNYFIQLENTRLRVNPGKFYHALSLMKRNAPGDNETAKKILMEVIDEKGMYKDIATEWIKKWKD